MNVLATITPAPDTTASPAKHRWVPAILTTGFWAQSDPNPEYSRLDRLDGLGPR